MAAAPTGKASLRRLTKRSQFLRAARGKRAGRPYFALQAATADAAEPGLGFTVSKQCGNAPERNRIKRRLRAAAGACADRFRPQHDYVIIGRRDALQAPFEALVRDLGTLIERVHTSHPKHNPADGGLRKSNS